MTALYDACRQYLESLPVVLWRDWDIKNPAGLDAATLWLEDTVHQINCMLGSELPPQ